MRHIRRVVIRAYRSIVRSDLRMGEVTVVTGGTDHGKSNLFRALRDWAFNAHGSDMISVGEDVARVCVVTANDSKVVWERRGARAGARSAYLLAPPGVECATRYEKVGVGVPDEVRDVTGARAIEVDDLSVRIQFQEQSDPWFLLANPPWAPGKVTKVVGKVAGLDALILANRDLQNERQGHCAERSNAEERLRERRVEAEQFEGLDAAQEACAAVEEALLRSEESKRSLASVEGAAEEVRRIRRSGRAAVLKLRAFAPVVRSPVIRRLDEGRAALEAVEAQLRTIRDLTAAAQGGVRAVEGLRGVVGALLVELRAVADASEASCPLCGGAMHDECRRALRDQAS